MFVREMQEYSSCELFDSYIERLESWMYVSRVKKQDRVHVLICMLGCTDYGTLRKLCHPNRPAKLEYKTCVKLLSNHFDEHQQVIVNDCQSPESESQSSDSEQPADPVCMIGAVRLVTSEESVHSPDGEATSEVSTGPHMVERVTTELLENQQLGSKHRNKPPRVCDNWRVSSHERESRPNRHFVKKTSGPCPNCGNVHNPSFCFAQNKICFSCGGRGHLARKCPRSFSSRNRAQSHVPYSSKVKSPSVKVKFNDTKVSMIVNPAVKHSFISESIYKQFFSDSSLHSSKTKFCHSVNQSFMPIGKIFVQPVIKKSCYDLSIKVVDVPADCDCVLGQDWMQKINLNWSKFFHTFYSDTSK
jgi:hypothetical protein